MNLKDYLKDKKNYILLLLFASLTCEILVIPTNLHMFFRIYIGLCPIVVYLICLFLEFFKKKNYYTELIKRLEELEEKYLISEILGMPDFIEGRILANVMQETGKSMLENVNKYKYLQEEYKEYIELWIHEIKLPISCGKMIIENNKSDVTSSINEELDLIENYVEQVLFYARSQVAEKDYLIKKQDLKEIINVSILKNKRNLIQNNIKINIHDVENTVYTDSKWCTFILNQIIQNSIKYSKENSREIEIFSKENKDNIILSIKDNGIGIKESDLSRVFDKGFTGENGRRNEQKATGIGLYLCKKLCNKLGLGIEIQSKENKETEVRIVFPKSSFLENAR